MNLLQDVMTSFQRRAKISSCYSAKETAINNINQRDSDHRRRRPTCPFDLLNG
jgi:hypothetical protein